MSTIDIPGRTSPDKVLWDFHERIRRLEAVPIRGHYQIKVFADENAANGQLPASTRLVVAGLGKFILAIPDDLQLSKLTDCFCYVTTAGTGDIEVQLRNVDRGDDPNSTGADMLSTPMTINAGDYTSYDSTPQRVIDPSTYQVFTGSMIAIDIIDDGGGDAQGLGVGIELAPPPPG